MHRRVQLPIQQFGEPLARRGICPLRDCFDKLLAVLLPPFRKAVHYASFPCIHVGRLCIDKFHVRLCTKQMPALYLYDFEKPRLIGLCDRAEVCPDIRALNAPIPPIVQDALHTPVHRLRAAVRTDQDGLVQLLRGQHDIMCFDRADDMQKPCICLRRCTHLVFRQRSKRGRPAVERLAGWNKCIQLNPLNRHVGRMPDEPAKIIRLVHVVSRSTISE